jgi:hypothetical protein
MLSFESEQEGVEDHNFKDNWMADYFDMYIFFKISTKILVSMSVTDTAPSFTL